MAIYLELTEVNSNLAGILAPVLLGGAAAAYVASAAGGIALKGGLLFLVDRARDLVVVARARERRGRRGRGGRRRRRHRAGDGRRPAPTAVRPRLAWLSRTWPRPTPRSRRRWS